MKRRLLLSVLLIAALLTGCAAKDGSGPAPTSAPTAEPAPTASPGPSATPTPTPEPVSPEVQAMRDKNEQVWREMHNRDWMEGRLVIPSVGIDVALFNWGKEPVGDYSTDKIVEIVRQEVVDREDSALLYYDDRVGNIIADHSNQDFSVLSNVQVGDTAYILSGDRMVTLECGFVSDGVNTGYGITDKDGGWNHPNTDYVLYTCLEDWTHIQIVGFETKNEEFFQMAWIDVGDNNSNSGVVSTMSLPADSGSGSSGAASATPAPTATPSPTPAPTAQPTAEPQAAPAPAVQQPVYVEQYGYDIYANTGEDYGYYPSGDGYLY